MALVRDLLQFLLGINLPFSWLFWSFVTCLLLVIGPVFIQVAPRMMQPPARLVVTEPGRVFAWVIGSLLLTLALVPLTMALAIVAAPFLIVLFFWMMLAAFFGYLALAQLTGQLLLTRLGHAAPWPWLSGALGIVVFRLVRALPIIGAGAHTLIVLIGYAACTAISWQLLVAWHKRRLPDAEHFAGETLVEWYPDGDPVDGLPSTGTGRPVIGNIRGDEDDTKKDENSSD